MVQRIESGRMQIANVGNAPMQQVQPRAVDYIGPRAQSQASTAMAQILDRMSGFLFEQAGQMRQREGLEFAATNPITPEQVQAAKGGDVSSLGVSKNPISIFGQAVQKARALELSGHFEMEGRNELVKLLSDIEAGTATSAQVTAKIASFSDGYGKSLSQIDPEAAFKFRATMATHGNTVLKAAYETELKQAKNQRMAKFDADFDNVVTLLQTTISQEPEKALELTDVFRANILQQSLLLGDAGLQKEYSTKFEVALRNAKINSVTRELLNDVYMNNPDDTLGRIRRGEIGNLSPVLQDMINNDFASVAKVTANFMVAVNQREQIATSAQEAMKRQGTNDAINLLEQIFPLSENDPRRRQLVAQLVDLPPGSVPIGTLKDLLDPGKEGNSSVEFNALNGIFQGTINTPDQIYGMPGLNGQQKLRLLKTLNSEDRRDQAELSRGLNKLAGINVTGGVVVLDPKGVEFARLNELRARSSEIQADALRQGKVIMPSQIIDLLTKEIEVKRNTEEAKAARTALEVYEKRDWIKGKITREGLTALEKKAGNDKNKINDLKRIKSLLEQAEGNR